MNVYISRNSGKVGVLIAICLSVFWLSACVASPPQPPISIPFAIHKKGSKVETEFVIKEDAIYAFSLQFMFKKNDPVDRARVGKLVGTSELDKEGKPKNIGVATPLTLKVVQLDDPLSSGEPHIVLDIAGEAFIVSSWRGDRYSKTIKNVSLTKGHYYAVITNQIDQTEMKDMTVNFSISRAYLGK